MAAVARERARGLLHDGRSRADAGGAREALTLTLALTRTLALTLTLTLTLRVTLTLTLRES